MRKKFGENIFPESPMESFLSLLLNALSDFVLIFLMVCAVVAMLAGGYEEDWGIKGFLDGIAILIAVGAVSLISAGNDYSKQLQFLGNSLKILKTIPIQTPFEPSTF